MKKIGGERGVRTLDAFLAHTHFPGVLLQPLRHLSEGGWIMPKQRLKTTFSKDFLQTP